MRRNRPTRHPPEGCSAGLWSDPPTLDPHLSSDTTSAGIVVEIFSGLVALNTDLQLVPDIADSWDISQDGKVYTFHIRDNARFQDGSPITASDFKWSFERAANPDTASPVADTYLGDIIGVDDVLEGKTTDIAGIRVIDDNTLQIEIGRSQSLLPGQDDVPDRIRPGIGRTWKREAATGRTLQTGLGRSNWPSTGSASGSCWSAMRTSTSNRRTWTPS